MWEVLNNCYWIWIDGFISINLLEISLKIFFSHLSVLLSQSQIYTNISFLYSFILKLSFIWNHITALLEVYTSHLHRFPLSHILVISKRIHVLWAWFFCFFFFTETICFFHTYYVCFIGPPININSHVHQEVDTYWSVFLRLTFMIFYLDLIHTMTL